MNEKNASVQIQLVMALDPHSAFEVLVEELRLGLLPEIIFEPGENGRLKSGGFVVGSITAWMPGKQITLQWHPVDWDPPETIRVTILFEDFFTGTRITVIQEGWDEFFGVSSELTGWFASQLAAPFFKSITPDAFGDWLTERQARRPSGAKSRSVYRDPLFHYPNFKVLLEELDLTPQDHLIAVGCGGGAFLKLALQSGCRAAAIDHSLDMVQLARSENLAAIHAGQLDIRHASANQLPFEDGAFTCAVMTGVLGFLPDPVSAFQEIRRVLAENGRFICLGSDPELRGTPAAPEPMASRLHFYTQKELRQIGVQAGFTFVQVIRRDLEPFAREAGVPEEVLALFSGIETRFLIARK